MTNTPKPGDVLLRGSLDSGFYLVDPVCDEVLARNLPTIAAAVEVARTRRAEVWQQHVDFRGRPMGDPFRLLRQFEW
jgi:hypothetical protein